jgi:uncharacterized membrane protein YgaE (UPF0421/DUF939 family)
VWLSLGRYTLLLREILKHTPQNHPDQETIPKAIKIISEHLTNVNYETGKTENRFNLQLLAEKLQDSSPLYDMVRQERRITRISTHQKG